MQVRKNIPRKERACHRKLTMTGMSGGNIIRCIRNSCSIYDDALEQCGEYTTIQTMAKWPRILKKELAAYRN